MLRWLAVLMAASAVLALAGSSGARGTCPGRTLAANQYWKVTFELAEGEPIMYACDQRRPGKQPVVISGDEIVYPAAGLQGRLVALAEESYDSREGGVVEIVRPDHPRDTFEQLRLPASGNVSDIVLQDRRRVAWIGCRSKLPSASDENEPPCPGGVIKHIYVQDRSAPPPRRTGQVVQAPGRTLVSGRSIRSTSLELRDGVISWREGDRTRRYRLR